MRKGKFFHPLLPIGLLIAVVSDMLRHLTSIPEDITDFCKGFGIAMILGSFYLAVKKRKESSKSSQQEL